MEMDNNQLVLHIGKLDDAYNVFLKIPEFDNHYGISEIKKRLTNTKHLILTIKIEGQPVGFKIGYETPSKKYFYSWLGGVLPQYRKLGIAEKLAKYQEDWVVNSGYRSILVKTRKKHQTMTQFLKKNNYKLLGTRPYMSEEETRLLYEKKLESTQLRPQNV